MAALKPRGGLAEVELGFVESPEDPNELTSPFFPSKVGGKPAWLDQENLPSPAQLTCECCSKPLVFLLQVYAPIREGDNAHAFHRTLFVFMCRDPQCHQTGGNGTKCFKVFRCQLAEKGVRPDEDGATPTQTFQDETNKDSELKAASKNCDVVNGLCRPLENLDLHRDDNTSLTTSDLTGSNAAVDSAVQSKPQTMCDQPPPLCIVCGCAGPKFCGKCKSVNYCSRDHQIHDWKSGHKTICSKLAEGKFSLSDLTYDPTCGVLLPEMEIVTEVEPDTSSLVKKPQRSEEERMTDYLKFVENGSSSAAAARSEFDVKSLEEAALSEHKTDKQFRAFKKRVALEPEQVIRYQRGGRPLLVSVDGAPEERGVPRCSCGAERVFEFQVMPQLLYYLKLDSSVSSHSIDWGTLLVYTCASSCHMGGGYHGELLWKQDFSK